MSTRRLCLASLVFAYAALAAACLFAADGVTAASKPLSALGLSPSLEVPLLCAIVGPPMLLVWGPGALPHFLFFTGALAAGVLWYVRRKETRPLALASIAFSWILGGLLSLAMSI